MTSQSANAVINLGPLGIDSSQSHSLTTSQFVQSCLSNVETISGVVHGQDVDSVAIVGERVTCATVHIVPTSNGGGASDVREAWEGALGSVTLGEKAVGSVATGGGGERARGIIVASVIGDSDGRGYRGDSEETSEELHFDVDWLIILNLI